MVILLDIGFPDIYGALIYLPIQLVLLIWYPIGSFIGMVLYLFNIVYIQVALFLNGIIIMANILLALVNSILVNFLPAPWIMVLSSIIWIIVGFRVYSFLKGITILGFRIGG